MPSNLAVLDNSNQNAQQQLLFYEEYKRLSSFELCFHSQELIQDLISKNSEFIAQLRPLSYSLVTHDQNNYALRKAKIEDLLKTFDTILLKLRTLGSIVHQRKLGLDQELHTNRLNSNDSLQAVVDDRLKREKEELIEQLKSKNQYIKLAIDNISNILWQINSIQTLKQQ